jgi:MSHA biogenesis protein MshQ
VLNSQDSCTSIPANAFNLIGALTGTSVNAVVTISGGNGTLTLTKPSPTSTGSVDIAANLGASGSDQSCLASHGGTAANLPWLRSRNGNCASTYDRDPSARASFGIYSPETKRTIHVREQF